MKGEEWRTAGKRVKKTSKIFPRFQKSVGVCDHHPSWGQLPFGSYVLLARGDHISWYGEAKRSLTEIHCLALTRSSSALVRAGSIPVFVASVAFQPVSSTATIAATREERAHRSEPRGGFEDLVPDAFIAYFWVYEERLTKTSTTVECTRDQVLLPYARNYQLNARFEQ